VPQINAYLFLLSHYYPYTIPRMVSLMGLVWTLALDCSFFFGLSFFLATPATI